VGKQQMIVKVPKAYKEEVVGSHSEVKGASGKAKTIGGETGRGESL